MDPFIYFLPAALNRKKLVKNLSDASQYRISLEKGETWPGLLLDTFDEEMLHSGKMFFQVGERVFCLELQTGQLLEQLSSEGWSFAGELPAGPVAALLKKVSSLRAFLPVAEVRLCHRHGLLLDDEGKTRARFYNLSIERGRKTVGVGSTQYLRGYDQAHADLCRSLEQSGATACRDGGQVYDFLKIKRKNYTAKPTVRLLPDAPVKESAEAIVRTFIRIARRNENGMVADHDTEFLHDYRVSLRKVRSVLSLFKGVFSPEETCRLKEDFASLMQKTNSLRDLDVYLLNRNQYFNLVPADSHQGLEVLFDYFAGERKEEHKSVARGLRSTSYRREIDRLEKLFAEGANLPGGPRGEEHSLTFARESILKRYAKVCKIARGIDDTTEDTVIHQLRINCKKLRYLMEFFAPLIAENELKSMIKALKVLQDNLGNFNDYSVQQIFLRRMLSEHMHDFGGLELKVAESVGALTAMLHQLQRKERGQVIKNFALFDSSETRAILAKLFETEESVDENNSLLQQ
jgi:CHAD domain-containing protein